MTEFLRTPDERFEGLSGYDFSPHWFDWEGLRLHYLDEGEGPPAVLFHGVPTWAFLYRKVVPVLIAAGFRAIAPDYPGFGRSDKPTDPDFYTYDRLTDSMTSLVKHLDLKDATAVVQDWGGPIGLRLAVEHPDRFRRLSILNTGLFTGGGRRNEAFATWLEFVERTPDLPIGRVVKSGSATALSDEVVAGYDAPFLDSSFKIGPRRLPQIVPLEPTDPGAEEMRGVAAALGSWQQPVQVLFGDSDPIFSVRAGARMAEHIPGAGDLEVVEGAGHFLQEDKGEEVAARIVEFLARSG